MTFLQIFNARLILIRAQRHLAQAHMSEVGCCKVFTSVDGRDAFRIVENSLQAIEREFDSKRRPAKQRRAIRRQAA